MVEALFVLKMLGCADGFVASQIKFGSFTYTTAFVLWLQKIKTISGRNILSVIGDYSYGIFYCYVLIQQPIRKVIEMAGLNNIWILNLTLCFTLTAIGSFLFVWIVRIVAYKMKGEKILSIIGF